LFCARRQPRVVLKQSRIWQCEVVFGSGQFTRGAGLALMATVPSVSCNPPASQFGGIREGSVFAAKRAASISWPRTCKPWPLVLWKQSEAIGSFSRCNRWRTGRSSSESHSYCCRSKGGRDDDGKDVELEQQPIRTLILDNYDSYTYNLFQLLSVINGGLPCLWKS
jgi:hypothetical protein